MGFSAATAFAESFALLKSRFAPMLAISILYYVLLFVLFGVFGAGVFGSMMTMGANAANPAALPAGFGLGMLFLYIAMYGLVFFQQAALCRLCSDRHQPNIGDALSTGVRSVPTLLGAAVLLVIGLFAVMIVFSIAGAVAMAGASSPVVSFIVALLMLVGSIYLVMRLSMLLPAVAIEDERNPITAIGRSWAMTRGRAFKLFLLFFALFVVMGAIGMAVFFGTIGVPQPGTVPGTGSVTAFFVLMVLFGLTVGMWFVALIAAIHRQLAGPSVAAVQETFA